MPWLFQCSSGSGRETCAALKITCLQVITYTALSKSSNNSLASEKLHSLQRNCTSEGSMEPSYCVCNKHLPTPTLRITW